jgi:hypothetical protein
MRGETDPLAPAEPDRLASARDLEVAGDPLGAIRVLTAANREQRDSVIEQMLVELRHRAYLAIEHAAPVSPPPAITADTVSPGPLQPLAPADLTPETLREGMQRHGCVFIRGLIPPARVAELVDGIDRALAACDAGLDGASATETAPWFVPFKPDPRYRVVGRRNWVRANGAVWTADSPRMLFELLDTLDEAGISALITDFLGEEPALSANKCVLRRVPVTSSGDWHQDGAFLGADVRSLNVWISLSHSGRDTPGLDIVPRRLDEIAETGTEGAYFDWSVSPALVEQIAESAPVVRPEFAPGDVLLFDHMLLHRTAIDPSMTHERYAIETWFLAPSCYPNGQVPLVY